MIEQVRKKRKSGEATSPSLPQPSNRAPLPGPSDRKMPAYLTDAMKSIFEQAADIARRHYGAAGKAVPMAFFVSENNAINGVSFSFTGELGKDAWIRRIKDKALAEKATCVLVLIGAEPAKKGVSILTGAAPGVKISARIDYAIDEKTKTVTSWKTSFLDQPVRNDFINRIFD
jgi:hypothetical protein